MANVPFEHCFSIGVNGERNAKWASRELSGNSHELKTVGAVEVLERQVIALP